MKYTKTIADREDDPKPIEIYYDEMGKATSKQGAQPPVLLQNVLKLYKMLDEQRLSFGNY